MESRQAAYKNSTTYILAALSKNQYQLDSASVTSPSVAGIARTDAIAGRVIGRIQAIADPGISLDEATGKVGQLQKIPGPDIQAKIGEFLNELSTHAKETEQFLHAKEMLLVECYQSEQSLKDLNKQLSNPSFSDKKAEIQRKIADATASLTKIEPRIQSLESYSRRSKDALRELDKRVQEQITNRKANNMITTAMETKLGGFGGG